MTSAGVRRYVWVSSRDERVRDRHRELNGKTFSWKDAPEVDGEKSADFDPESAKLIADMAELELLEAELT